LYYVNEVGIIKTRGNGNGLAQDNCRPTLCDEDLETYEQESSVLSETFYGFMLMVNTWTDRELEAAVDAYFVMLGKELNGEPCNKAEVNRQLRSSVLSQRSKGAIEYRMQNISDVLQKLCHPFIQGYMPRQHVGTNLTERIKKLIFHKNLVNERDYATTADETEIENRVQSLLSKGVVGKPQGRRRPKRQQTSQTAFERDPLVKAWLLQNANGICELCGNAGPFLDKSGRYFLEVHHVVFLVDGGSDVLENTAALCPNCHRKCHLSPDADAVRQELRDKIERIK
jgi:5-methylcytosine-specific restriction protein A